MQAVEAITLREVTKVVVNYCMEMITFESGYQEQNKNNHKREPKNISAVQPQNRNKIYT